VAQFCCPLPDGTVTWFIDMPGFDDTYKMAADVLCEISDWLSSTYENRIHLSGIIYLHRIWDTRIGDSGMRYQRMFKKLVGDKSLANVVLASTMWSMLPNLDIGTAREWELRTKDELWGHMIQHGSQVFRQDRGRESAAEIVQHIVSSKVRATLDIQRDMVDHEKQLSETAAGQEVKATLKEEQEKFQRLIVEIEREKLEASAEREMKHRRELDEYERRIEEQLRSNEEAVERLRIIQEEIRREVNDSWEAERVRLIEEHNRKQAKADARAEKAREEERREEERRERLSRQQAESRRLAEQAQTMEADRAQQVREAESREEQSRWDRRRRRQQAHDAEEYVGRLSHAHAHAQAQSAYMNAAYSVAETGNSSQVTMEGEGTVMEASVSYISENVLPYSSLRRI